MTNWIDNKIVIYADKDKLETIVSQAFDSDREWLAPNKIVPLPKDIKSFSEEKRIEWYGENWGFDKMAICEKTIRDNCLVIDIETGWSPCIPLVKKLSEKFNVEIYCWSHYDLDDWFYWRLGEASYKEFYLEAVEINIFEVLNNEKFSKIFNLISSLRKKKLERMESLDLKELNLKDPFSDEILKESFEKQEKDHIDANL